MRLCRRGGCEGGARGLPWLRVLRRCRNRRGCWRFGGAHPDPDVRPSLLPSHRKLRSDDLAPERCPQRRVPPERVI